MKKKKRGKKSFYSKHQNFSVVLASSSSMFICRILDHTINRASVFVKRDLSRNESKLFWENYLPKKYPKVRSDRLPTFEAVFECSWRPQVPPGRGFLHQKSKTYYAGAVVHCKGAVVKISFQAESVHQGVCQLSGQSPLSATDLVSGKH